MIGYDRATELAAEALRTGKGVVELVREKKILTEEQIAEVLDPAAMTGQDGLHESQGGPRGRRLALALTGFEPAVAGQEPPGSEAWSSFEGTWSAAGRRHVVAVEADAASDRRDLWGGRAHGARARAAASAARRSATTTDRAWAWAARLDGRERRPVFSR